MGLDLYKEPGVTRPENKRCAPLAPVREKVGRRHNILSRPSGTFSPEGKRASEAALRAACQSAGRYSTTSRSNPDIALNFIGELIRRILRTPRSRRICEPAPTVL